MRLREALDHLPRKWQSWNLNLAPKPMIFLLHCIYKSHPGSVDDTGKFYPGVGSGDTVSGSDAGGHTHYPPGPAFPCSSSAGSHDQLGHEGVFSVEATEHLCPASLLERVCIEDFWKRWPSCHTQLPFWNPWLPGMMWVRKERCWGVFPGMAKDAGLSLSLSVSLSVSVSLSHTHPQSTGCLSER